MTKKGSSSLLVIVLMTVGVAVLLSSLLLLIHARCCRLRIASASYLQQIEELQETKGRLELVVKSAGS